MGRKMRRRVVVMEGISRVVEVSVLNSGQFSYTCELTCTKPVLRMYVLDKSYIHFISLRTIWMRIS